MNKNFFFTNLLISSLVFFTVAQYFIHFFIFFTYSIGCLVFVLTFIILVRFYSDYLIIFFILLFSLFSTYFISRFIHLDNSLRLITLFLNIGIGVYLFHYYFHINNSFFRVIFWIYSFYLIYLFLINPSLDPNDIFLGSRNHVWNIAFTLYSFIIFFNKNNSSKNFYFFEFLSLTAISFLSESRSSFLIVSFLSIAIFLFYLFKNFKSFFIIISILFSSIILFFSFFNTFTFDNANIFVRFEQKGLTDASRLDILISYFSDITFFDFLFGRNIYFSEDTFGISVHNSFIALHQTIGFLSFIILLFLVCLFPKIFNLFGFYRSALVLCLLFKSATDHIAFTADLLIGSLLFFIIINCLKNLPVFKQYFKLRINFIHF